MYKVRFSDIICPSCKNLIIESNLICERCGFTFKYIIGEGRVKSSPTPPKEGLRR